MTPEVPHDGYLADFPLSEVGEIHLAGHSEQTDDEGDRLIIDSHDGPVASALRRWYHRADASRQTRQPAGEASR